MLAALDGHVLAQHQCWFGGGTCIALRYGEYRESVDIDFLVSDAAAYRELRQMLTGSEGFAKITRQGSLDLQLARDVRVDQYGIRTQVLMDGRAIKFEIVSEARIELQMPTEQNKICGISTLTELDLVASKLLANADRQADDGVFSRDLIDLAIDRVEHRVGWLDRCMQAMSIQIPKAVLWQNIRKLRRVLPSG